MGAVAVGAHGGFFRAGSDGVSVHALLVRSDHLRALAAILHYEFLAVTCAAGRGDVGVVYLRLRIARRQQLVRAAVAIHAGGRAKVAALDSFAVEAAIIGGLFVGMAGGATDFLWSVFVRGALYVSVTIHAGKHAAVDGVFEFLRIDVQADRLAIDVVAEGVIAVAREALFGRRFGRFFLGRGLKRDRC